MLLWFHSLLYIVMSTLRDTLQSMIVSFDFCTSDGKSPKSSSQSLTVGIVEVLKQYPLTRDLVHDKILYFYQIQLKLDKNPQNCKNSFCLGPFLTTKSRRYDDYKDSLSEIFFRNYAHKQGHMTGWPWAKQLAEQSATHMVENGRMTTHIRTRQQRASGRNDEKIVARHKQTLLSSSWMPL